MRNLTTVFAILLIGAATTFSAQAEDQKQGAIVSITAIDMGRMPLAAPIEQCIRGNAAKVEAAVPDLSQAVDFLVGKICAEPIAKENARVLRNQQERMAADWQKMCDEEKAAKRTNSTTTDRQNMGVDYCALGKVGFAGIDPYTDDDNGGPMYIGAGSPAAIALAARLLLDLRLAHKKPGHAE